MRGFDHYSGKFLIIDDAKIYYEIIGSEGAPVLLVLHGGLGNIEDFNNVISDLVDDYKIIGIDSRGHGKSTLGSQELSYELLQKEVEIILQHLNIHKLTILGFSNGGTIAYRLAALTKLQIDKLITVGAPWCSKHIEHLREAYLQLTSDSWKALCPSNYELYTKLNPKPELDFLFKQAIKMGLDNSTKSRPNEDIRNISCPLLVVRGENDPIVSNSDLIELSKFVKHAHIINIPLAGHEVFEDQPELFVAQLKHFLNY